MSVVIRDIGEVGDVFRCCVLENGDDGDFRKCEVEEASVSQNAGDEEGEKEEDEDVAEGCFFPMR